MNKKSDNLLRSKVKRKPHSSRFLPFANAREIARTLNFKTICEWRRLTRSKDRIPSIPVLPHLTYKQHGWTDYPDFLNYKKKIFLPFHEAREFVRSLKLKTGKEWSAYASSNKKPTHIPYSPWFIYKKQFKGIVDWLGSPPKKYFLPFDEARKYIREAKKLNGSNWWEWCRANRPPYIPIRPDKTYKGKGWKGWVHWCGKGKKEFLPFREARKLARTLGIHRVKEWNLYCKQGKRPYNIPANPNTYYREFKNYPDFFKYKRENYSRFPPYEEAQKLAKTLGIKSVKDWTILCKRKKRPKQLPRNLYIYQEFQGFPDFFGYKQRWIQRKTK